MYVCCLIFICWKQKKIFGILAQPSWGTVSGVFFIHFIIGKCFSHSFDMLPEFSGTNQKWVIEHRHKRDSIIFFFISGSMFYFWVFIKFSVECWVLTGLIDGSTLNFNTLMYMNGCTSISYSISACKFAFSCLLFFLRTFFVVDNLRVFNQPNIETVTFNPQTDRFDSKLCGKY